MSKYLLVDIGSTYTKLTAVDLEKEDIIATSKSYTTIEDDVRIGYNKALKNLYEKAKEEIIFDKIYACSSAAGGLKMAAIGLVEELTVEAAKRVCLNAGGKVDLVLTHNITKSEVEEIKKKKIDIVLLAGGTDGGNTECVIHNANMLGMGNIDIPIIFAGNKSARDEIEVIFKKYNLNGYICDNVMPKLNELNITTSREVIKKIFLENIVEAKGISKLANDIDGLLLPTPHAVLNAAELLSIGYSKEKGLGDSILVDVGGATTDIYSFAKGLPKTPNTVLHGLEEPFSKRTVEGDLGMRYSTLGIINNLTEAEISSYKEDGIDIVKEAHYRRENVEMIPSNNEEESMDNLFASLCVDVATSRHVGTVESVYTPLGVMYYQEGKDLSDVQTIIGTGGVIVNSKDPSSILEKVKVNIKKPMELRPKDSSFYIDSDYILSAMGLLSQSHPEIALRIMKKRIKRI